MSELDDTASAKPQLRSLSGAAQMMAHRWPHIALATFAIIALSLSNLARPLVIQYAIDSGFLNNDSGAIVEASLIFVVLAVAAYAFQGLSTYLVSWIGQGFIRDLRMRLFTHLQRLSMSFYDKENSGRLL